MGQLGLQPGCASSNQKKLRRPKSALRMTVNDARFVQVVGRHLDVHFVANRDADEILAHFAGDMGKDLVPVGERDTEHRAGKHLRYVSSQFDWLFFWHNVCEPSSVPISSEKSIFFA